MIVREDVRESVQSGRQSGLLRWQDNPYSKGYLAIICPKCGVSVTVRYINLEVDFEHGYCVAVAN